MLEPSRMMTPNSSACGHAEPRIRESEARHQRKNAPGVGPRRQWKKVGSEIWLGVAIWAVALAAGARIVTVAAEQTVRSINLQVSETTGIRRTEYPVSARVELPKSGLADPDHVALRTGGADVPAQYSVASRWDDQSVRALELDFNVS